MSVEADHDGIARTAARMGGEGTVLLLLRGGAAVDADRLAAFLHPGDEPPNGGWFKGPTGWLLLLEGLPLEINSFVDTLANRLSEAGIDGVLTGAGAAAIPTWADSLHESLRLYSLIGYQPRGGAAPYDGWITDREVLGEAARHATSWVAGRATQVMASVDLRANFWVDTRTATRLLIADALRSGRASASGYDRTSRIVREAYLTQPSCLSLTAMSDRLNWQELVDDARGALLSRSLQQVSVAMVAKQLWSSMLRDTLPGEGPVHGWAYSWHPEIWHQYTLDPCGIQILTNEHLEKARDLSDWSVTRLDATHHFVEARDLEPWYGSLDTKAPAPPGVLDQARRDFGAMILTSERAERLGYATKPRRPEG